MHVGQVARFAGDAHHRVHQLGQVRHLWNDPVWARVVVGVVGVAGVVGVVGFAGPAQLGDDNQQKGNGPAKRLPRLPAVIAQCADEAHHQLPCRPVGWDAQAPDHVVARSDETIQTILVSILVSLGVFASLALVRIALVRIKRCNMAAKQGQTAVCAVWAVSVQMKKKLLPQTGIEPVSHALTSELLSY